MKFHMKFEISIVHLNAKLFFDRTLSFEIKTADRKVERIEFEPYHLRPILVQNKKNTDIHYTPSLCCPYVVL